MKIRRKIGCTNQSRISYRWIHTLHISLLHFVYSCFLYHRYLKQASSYSLTFRQLPAADCIYL